MEESTQRKGGPRRGKNRKKTQEASYRWVNAGRIRGGEERHLQEHQQENRKFLVDKGPPGKRF